ncbi:acetylornithine aminotransferase [Streptomyces sp. CB00316]|uniref:aspartate aminotransferase family protein n=1 Tax=unclassified Streptomyces TaxID=2593676 RepID=UPI00093F4731|nr:MULTISPECIES: aminotransferase class III-fold pyridoxal phosphate-dependent enzyme [unclassified Streptomyces]MBT2381567.1 aspartate aminotransferase family protein [Streptomyces sp. ISL-111]MBT2429034.1 aspartate aminotransferase family protein [Streptomyces sp. ISL-112]MBT2464068.1 aspartate aminotransferase family protein [Streptomyces sp. ISL-63]OKJ20031.1 acetylornithine aminotransferase [Streptomyces sp. CB00316]
MTTTTDSPVHDREHIGRLYRANLSKGRATLGELFGGHIETGSEGAWILTDDGRRFLNCGSYGVLITGARHPTVVRHVTEQLGRHPVASRVFLEPQAALAAEALAARAPAGLERVHFACSGAEAVETAIKIARTRGKDQLVATHGGYHGKTMGALSLTGKDVFQDPFRPLLPGVHHVPYGDADALEELLRAMPGRACFVVEPVQGEAGVVLPPPGYLRAVQELCRTYDALLVLDEIQTGLGRLGTWWGADADGVTPDVLLAGKALGGGILPVSAVIATPKAFAAFDKDPYLHTSTFSGTPMAMAAVRGALAAIEEDGLVDRARDLGAEMLTTVRDIAQRHFGPVLREVRGRGLLIGIEFAIPGPAGDLLIELISQGVVANHSLNSHLVIRLTPPAVLSAADTRFLYEAFDRACRAQAARYVPTFEGDSAHA